MEATATSGVSRTSRCGLRKTTATSRATQAPTTIHGSHGTNGEQLQEVEDEGDDDRRDDRPPMSRASSELAPAPGHAGSLGL